MNSWSCAQRGSALVGRVDDTNINSMSICHRQTPTAGSCKRTAMEPMMAKSLGATSSMSAASRIVGGNSRKLLKPHEKIGCLAILLPALMRAP